MYPPRFVYLQAKNPGEASAFLAQYKDEAKILAGGQSLIPMMKLRLATPKYVIDISDMEGLSYIREATGRVEIGALTRQSEVEQSLIIREKLPILAEAATQIADRQVRNLGTLGGAICHADPAGDWSACMLAIDAEFQLRSSKARYVKAKEFFRGPFETALEPDEILTEVRVPVQSGGRAGQAYVKFERRAGDFATVGIAASVTLTNGMVKDVALVVCAAGPVPFEVVRVGEMMRGREPDLALVEAVAAEAATQSQPEADLRGSAEYKREMVRVFTKRALKQSLARAGCNL